MQLLGSPQLASSLQVVSGLDISLPRYFSLESLRYLPLLLVSTQESIPNQLCQFNHHYSHLLLTQWFHIYPRLNSWQFNFLFTWPLFLGVLNCWVQWICYHLFLTFLSHNFLLQLWNYFFLRQVLWIFFVTLISRFWWFVFILTLLQNNHLWRDFLFTVHFCGHLKWVLRWFGRVGPLTQKVFFVNFWCANLWFFDTQQRS